MKKFNFLFISILFLQISFSQSNLLNAENPDDIGVKTKAQLDKDDESVLEYAYVQDKDVLFSKTVWEIIDLDQRINFPLLYPTDTATVGQERRPLIHYLIKGIQNGTIPKVYNDGKFNVEKPLSVFEASLVDSVYTPDGIDEVEKFGSARNFLQNKGVDLGEYEIDYTQDEVDNFGDEEYNKYQDKLKSLTFKFLTENIHYNINTFQYDMVYQYLIKGVWYFDKIQSDLRYRILAIAPITSEIKNKEKRVELFWVYYRHAREALKDAYVFSDRNSAVRISFDELINARRFSSVIFLEENVQEDRKIQDYVLNNSFMQLLESQRIKEKIRNLEHDMWSW